MRAGRNEEPEVRPARVLSAAALTSVPQSTWSDSSSSTSGESSSYSSSGASSADWDEFEAENAWRATVTQFGFVSMLNAAEPFSRKKVTYKVGPERYSFARLEREYGSSGDASCKRRRADSAHGGGCKLHGTW